MSDKPRQDCIDRLAVLIDEALFEADRLDLIDVGIGLDKARMAVLDAILPADDEANPCVIG